MCAFAYWSKIRLMNRGVHTLGLALATVAFLGTGVFAQEAAPKMIAEFKRTGGGGCDPFFQLTYLMDELQKAGSGTGLVVVYDGGGDERFGNLMAFVRNAPEWLKWPPGKIKFMVGHGKDFFDEELWIIPDGAQPPKINAQTFDWNSVEGTYYFSNACLSCEPSYPWLSRFQANFDDYARILKDHPQYSGIIRLSSYEDLRSVVKSLTHELKVPRNRYKIILSKPTPETDLSVDLYLVKESVISKNI
jgi:hypothetical protein